MRIAAGLALFALPAVFAAAACSSANENSGFTTKDGGNTVGQDAGFEIPTGDDGGGATGGFDGGFAECAKGKTGARRVPGYIQLVLDGSGSMGGSKWTALQRAVRDVVAKWQADGDPTFGVGVSIFSDSKDSTSGSGPYPTPSDVRIKIVDQSQANAISSRVGGSSGGGTPSLTALTGNYKYIDGFNPASVGLPTGGKKIVVFMSDGDPTDDTAAVSSDSSNLAKQYKAKGILTFSILFADSGTRDSLRQFMAGIAFNGGGVANAGCSPTATNPSKYCHFEIDTSSGNSTQIAQKFYDAILQARNAIDPCSLTIEKPAGGDFDPGLVNVTITSGSGAQTPVVKDPANGWTYDDPANPQNVILHGAACDQVKNDAKASVELVLGCPTVSK